MALAATQQNQIASIQCARGSRTGTRTEPATFDITLPFNPKVLRFVNLTDRIEATWFDETLVPGAGNTAQLLTVAAGTRTFAGAGISVANNVATITIATATLSANDKTCYWEAWA
jgi:hypothetical protein